MKLLLWFITKSQFVQLRLLHSWEAFKDHFANCSNKFDIRISVLITPYFRKGKGDMFQKVLKTTTKAKHVIVANSVNHETPVVL